MMKRKSLRSLLISVVAVFMVMLFATGMTAFAEEPETESITQSTELTTEADDTVTEDTAAAEDAPAENSDGEKKSNPIMNGILVLVVVGAVIICVREIHRDNHRPV